ncbi:MAG: mechanosensitive ion channel [DPANN group archaeon]|nr:mechanosensitive ion channel [DPANN group archaeon]
MVSLLEIRTFLEGGLPAKIAAASIIVAASIIGAHFVANFAEVLMKKSGLKTWLQKRGVKNPAGIIEYSIRYIIYIFAFIFALFRLGIFTPVIALIVIILGALASLAAYFELRNRFTDLLAWPAIKKLSVTEGDNIKIGDFEGTVSSVGLFDLRLETKSGVIVLPNRLAAKSKITNLTKKL